MYTSKILDHISLEYEQFVCHHPLNSISQSQIWGKMQSHVPTRGKYWAIEVRNETDEIVGVCTLIRHILGKGRCYLYAHRGPIGDMNDADFVEALMSCIAPIAKQENAIFLRLDPLQTWESYSELSQQKDLWKKYNFVPAHAQYQPLNSLYIDLTVAQEEILAQMSQTGRRNIRKAESAGVTIRTSIDTGKDLDTFYRLMEITTDRDGFYGHNKEYYKTIIEGITKYGLQIMDNFDHHCNERSNPEIQENGELKTENSPCLLYFAEYQGKTLATAIVTFYGKTAIYYYGASDNEHRDVMAPYLLHWQIIQDARARGCEVYDWLGVSPEAQPIISDKGQMINSGSVIASLRSNPEVQENGKLRIENGESKIENYLVYMGNSEKIFSSKELAEKWTLENHQFAKITQFKTRFGGKKMNYIGAWEFIYKPKEYWILVSLKNFRRMIRKLLKLKV